LRLTFEVLRLFVSVDLKNGTSNVKRKTRNITGPEGRRSPALAGPRLCPDGLSESAAQCPWPRRDSSPRPGSSLPAVRESPRTDHRSPAFCLLALGRSEER